MPEFKELNSHFPSFKYALCSFTQHTPTTVSLSILLEKLYKEVRTFISKRIWRPTLEVIPEFWNLKKWPEVQKIACANRTDSYRHSEMKAGYSEERPQEARQQQGQPCGCLGPSLRVWFQCCGQQLQGDTDRKDGEGKHKKVPRSSFTDHGGKRT